MRRLQRLVVVVCCCCSTIWAAETKDHLFEMAVQSYQISRYWRLPREAGVAVFHLAQETCAPKYRQYLAVEKDPELRAPLKKTPFEVSVEPGTVDEMWETEYRPDFPGPV